MRVAKAIFQLAFPRNISDFDDFPAARSQKLTVMRQRLMRRHPTSARLSFYLSSRAGAIDG
jgi:hypothetical protein